MWGCWGSKARLTAWVLLAFVLSVPGRAAARVTVNGVELRDSLDSHGDRIHVSGRGVVVSRGAGVVIGEDTLGSGALVIDDETDGMVRVMSDAWVKPGERFEGDVVAVFGDVKVEGHVTGAAVAVFGRLEIAPGGSVGDEAVAVFGGLRSAGPVNGDAVSVFGSVQLEEGATVGGDAVAVGGRVEGDDRTRIAGQSVSVGLLPLTLGLPTLSAVLALIVIGWLVTLFFGWLFALLFPARLARVGVTASRHTFFSIVIAGLSVVVWPVAAILIMATIIGLPVGLVLWFAYPLVVYAGQLGATYVLGCKLLRQRLGTGSAMGPMVAGSLFIALLFAAAAISYAFGGAGGAVALFFGLVGTLVLLGLTAIGTGAFLLSRAGSRPLHVGAAAADGAAA